MMTIYRLPTPNPTDVKSAKKKKRATDESSLVPEDTGKADNDYVTYLEHPQPGTMEGTKQFKDWAAIFYHDCA